MGGDSPNRDWSQLPPSALQQVLGSSTGSFRPMWMAPVMEQQQLLATSMDPTIAAGQRQAANKQLSKDMLKVVMGAGGADITEAPWQTTRDQFYQTHTHVKPGYSSYEEGQRLSQLHPDTKAWVWHATDDATAKQLAEKGINPSEKPMNLARQRYEQGGYAEYAPGRGLSGGTYVAATPQDVSGYGTNMLGIRVRLGDLGVSPEQQALGVNNGAQALASGDAVITQPVDPQDIVHFGRSNRYPADAHRELVRHALAQGESVPANVLADYPDLVGGK